MTCLVQKWYYIALATMAESTVAFESDLILLYKFKKEGKWVPVKGLTKIAMVAMTARLVSPSGLAIPHGAVSRSVLPSSVTAVERWQR